MDSAFFTEKKSSERIEKKNLEKNYGKNICSNILSFIISFIKVSSLDFWFLFLDKKNALSGRIVAKSENGYP